MGGISPLSFLFSQKWGRLLHVLSATYYGDKERRVPCSSPQRSAYLLRVLTIHLPIPSRNTHVCSCTCAKCKHLSPFNPTIYTIIHPLSLMHSCKYPASTFCRPGYSRTYVLLIGFLVKEYTSARCAEMIMSALGTEVS